MNEKKLNLRPPTDEETKELFRGIIQEDRDHGHIPPRVIKCGDCANCFPKVLKCKIYPDKIPMEIIKGKVDCKEFKQK